MLACLPSSDDWPVFDRKFHFRSREARLLLNYTRASNKQLLLTSDIFTDLKGSIPIMDTDYSREVLQLTCAVFSPTERK